VALGVDSACNRNEYLEYFLGVNAVGAYGRQTCHLYLQTVLNCRESKTPGALMDLSKPEMAWQSYMTSTVLHRPLPSPAGLIVLYFITQIKFSKEYKRWAILLFFFIHCHVLIFEVRIFFPYEVRLQDPPLGTVSSTRAVSAPTCDSFIARMMGDTPTPCLFPAGIQVCGYAECAMVMW